MTPPFSAVSKNCDPPSVSNPLSPLLISYKSLSIKNSSSPPVKFSGLISPHLIILLEYMSRCIFIINCD